VQGTYSPCSDGRVVLSNEAWRTIVAWNNLKINDIVMFLFHQFGEHFTSTKAIHISVDVIWFWFATRSNSFVMREMINFVIWHLSLYISRDLSNVMTKTCLCYLCFHIQCAMYCCLYCVDICRKPIFSNTYSILLWRICVNFCGTLATSAPQNYKNSMAHIEMRHRIKI
jgi:hypothetical protein